jgi:hypothetical protein
MDFKIDVDFGVGPFHVKLGTVDEFPAGTKVAVWNRWPSGVKGYAKISLLVFTAQFGIAREKQGLTGLANAKVGLVFTA